MIELNVVGQEVFMWLQTVAGYVVTLPIPALLALVLPFLAAFLARKLEEQLQRERLFNYGPGSEGLNLRP